MKHGAWLRKIAGLKSFGLLFVLAAGLGGCATSPGLNGAGKDAIQVAPGISVEAVLQAATAAGKQMNYAVTREGNRLVMAKRLPFGVGNIVGDPARHSNRITVSAIPGEVGASTEVRVEGEYLGDLRNRDLANCVPCDVSQIKKAIRETR
jgi:hypothetical protein